MAYPSMTEYNEAVQNPQFVFNDPELKRCNISLTPLKMPRVASGGFALTYQLQSNGRKWAVRCFHREAADLQKRYSNISEQLEKVNSNFFVGFEYQSQGIKVNTKTYPIVKMDWIDGILLNTYIEDHVNDFNVLDSLSKQFKDCIFELEKYGIAHGDLQHGNVIVCKNELKLIDYDGMYVPAMQFKISNELGHINYQHPLRTEKSFGNKLDRFSTLVIYTAINALKVNPSLWNKYDNGENLLFKRDDFLNPEQSKLFKELRSINGLRGLVENLIKISKGSFESIPSLDEFINGNLSIAPANSINVHPKRQYEVVDATNSREIAQKIGQVVEIVGRVENVKVSWTKNHTRYAFINFGDYKLGAFRLVIWQEGLSHLYKQDIDVNNYKNKWVSVTGLITSYNNQPQITIDRTIKINVFNDVMEARKILNEGNKVSYSPNSKNGDILQEINKIPINSRSTGINTNKLGAAQTKKPIIAVPTRPKNNNSQGKNQQMVNQIKNGYSLKGNQNPIVTNVKNSQNSNSTRLKSNNHLLYLIIALVVIVVLAVLLTSSPISSTTTYEQTEAIQLAKEFDTNSGNNFESYISNDSIVRKIMVGMQKW